jgi:hypothetical protein
MTLAMETAKPPEEIWIMAIRNTSENTLAMFKVLKVLSLINRNFKIDFNDDEIARALLTYQ